MALPTSFSKFIAIVNLDSSFGALVNLFKHHGIIKALHYVKVDDFNYISYFGKG